MRNKCVSKDAKYFVEVMSRIKNLLKLMYRTEANNVAYFSLSEAVDDGRTEEAYVSATAGQGNDDGETENGRCQGHRCGPPRRLHCHGVESLE